MKEYRWFGWQIRISDLSVDSKKAWFAVTLTTPNGYWKRGMGNSAWRGIWSMILAPWKD